MQAMQALALDRNIDLSVPANANLMAQLFPLMQSMLVAQHKPSETNMDEQSSSVTMPKQQVTSAQVANENSPRGNSSSDVSGHFSLGKVMGQTSQASLFGASIASIVPNANHHPAQPFSGRGSDSQLLSRQPTMIGNGVPSMHPPQSPPEDEDYDEDALAFLRAQRIFEVKIVYRPLNNCPGRSSEVFMQQDRDK
ncbi:hypothetical protein POM88_005630 [Heracleum sosnowskyi]|uniref:Uncharacterized protein n=1 Tax=Heracleum sosnowskyi TaxID=360622 RepID=A0AAD8J150_9APIA|nr:hypothetical protein POM88_005630 [Heracleum sosnowskyi]